MWGRDKYIHLLVEDTPKINRQSWDNLASHNQALIFLSIKVPVNNAVRSKTDVGFQYAPSRRHFSTENTPSAWRRGVPQLYTVWQRHRNTVQTLTDLRWRVLRLSNAVWRTPPKLCCHQTTVLRDRVTNVVHFSAVKFSAANTTSDKQRFEQNTKRVCAERPTRANYVSQLKASF